jgi:hypothetical protein
MGAREGGGSERKKKKGGGRRERSIDGGKGEIFVS